MNTLPRIFVATIVAGLAVVMSPWPTARLRAQPAAAPALSADALFADASAKEAAVRKVLSEPAPSVALLKAVRTVVADYESLVRRYPTSGLCDDALWKAAQLSSDAFAALGDPGEQAAATRLMARLISQYPTSKFARNAQPARETGSRPAVPAPRPASTSPSPLATIVAIRRAVVGDVVRVVIELDAEVMFHDERIENPARVFVDLPSTRTIPALKDLTMRFDGDANIVRQVRVGTHPDNKTRVVLEAAGVSSYSVYPLYSPYRLVIDCLRAMPAVADEGGAARPEIAGPFAVAAPSQPAATTAAARPAPVAPPAPLAPAPVVSPPPVLGAERVDGWNTSPPAALASAGSTGSAGVSEDSSDSRALTASVSPPTSPVPPLRNTAGGFSMARQLGLGVSRIVIDPGHGGHDPGAEARGVSEAELVLDVSLRLEKLLAKVPGTEVVLTRRTDDFVSLQERTAIANREGADLLLSIHANASSSPQLQGVETYFLNFANTLSAAAVAARENAASGQAMGDLPDAVKAIALQSKLDESRDFATYVQREMVAKLRPTNKTLRDLGVKQAPFVVLIGAAMPSVLAEISFMTSTQDAKLLKSSQYRDRVAEALFNAIRKYQTSLKTPSVVAQQSR